jgi:hypothetical protein
VAGAALVDGEENDLAVLVPMLDEGDLVDVEVLEPGADLL